MVAAHVARDNRPMAYTEAMTRRALNIRREE